MTSMDTRPLGHSGIQVSPIGLGCNQFGGRVDLSGTRAVIDAAISNGITFLDTADRYNGTKSEQFIGEDVVFHAPDNEGLTIQARQNAAKV